MTVDNLYKEFQKFSYENWWVYLVLFSCLIIIYVTNSGSILEIVLVFLVYVFADLCIMNMVSLMEKNNYSLASIFQLLGNSIFTSLFLYHFLYSWQLQYLVGSVGFILGTIKNISTYHFSFPLKLINGFTIFGTNIAIFVLTYTFFLDINIQIFFQACGWIFFSSSLVPTHKYNTLRYFSGFIGLVSMVIGSWIWLYIEFLQGSIYGVTLCYFLLPLSVFLVYIKTLRNYL